MRLVTLISLCVFSFACSKSTPATSGTTSGTSTSGTTGPSFTRLSNSSSGSGSTSSSSGSTSSSATSTSTSGSGTTSGSSGTSGTTGATNDLDQDGLDDALETQLATEYLPYVSYSSSENCGHPDGFVVRVFPHPADSSRPPRYVEIRYDHLYEQDCGTAGHPGDDENFAITVDTSLPAPQGIMVIAAISHRNTTCEHDSWCVQQSWSNSPCSGYATCDTPPTGSGRDGFPVVYVSQDKHGDYTTTNGCFASCDFGSCELNALPELAPILNVGEPGHPLVSNLTTQGFINLDAGWTDTTLYDYDPWGSAQFGGAGTVSADLTDSALEPPLCN